jgi:formyltetrahydrofolate-dependent phosphoribosylglycinamide formyltransferase
MLHLAIFISGRGSNLQAIHTAIRDGRLDASIELVVSHSTSAAGLAWAEKEKIDTAVIDPSDGDALLDLLTVENINFIALAGYLKLVPSTVVSAYRNRIVNIHPALLPSFGGKGMYGHFVHEAVLASGAKFSGATVHIVSDEYDRGPIVHQDVVPVTDEDTPESLAQKVLVIEHQIYPEALQFFAEGRVRVDFQRTFIQPKST